MTHSLKLAPAVVDRLDEYAEAKPSERIEPENAPNPIVRAIKRAFFLDRD